MRKALFIGIMFASSLGIHSQNLTELNFLSQLPRTTDDFQKYQFDYELENLQDHLPSAPFAISSPVAANFYGIGIFPFEHNCPVKEIECTLLTKRGGKDMVCYTATEKFDDYGTFLDFTGTSCYKEQSWWADGIKSSIKGANLQTILCIPNPYQSYIAPTKNSKGLISKIGNDLTYKYDANDRVIEVNHSSGKYSYKYEYLDNSKKIQTIHIYLNGRIRGKVIYTYSSGRISKSHGTLYNETGYEGSVEKEFIKTYTYDSNGGKASVVYEYKTAWDSGQLHKYTFDNKYDSKGRIEQSSISMNRSSHSGSYGGRMQEPTSFTRSYTYDSKGNWVKIDDGNYSVTRRIKYNPSMLTAVTDENHVFEEKDVDVAATMGTTLKKLKNSQPYQNSGSSTSGELVYVDFIVEKDGSISDFNKNRRDVDSEDAETFIRNLTWIAAKKAGKSVRSYVTLVWRNHETREKFFTSVIKDVKFTTKEADAYKNEASSINQRKNKKYIEELEIEAKGGNYYATRKLAYEYINGEHVEKNLDKALKYSVDVIEQVPNNPEIQKFLMANRERVFSNISYVQRLSKLANPTWNTDDPWCQFLLFAAAVSGNSDVVYNQLENSKNYNLNSRLEWLLWASKQYNYHAMFQLSELYLDSSNKLFDVEKGIMWLTKAADAGHRIARQQLGYYYKKGIFVEKDKKKAKMYLND